jgi:MerR family transcriptional regulator, Zn(II)-responsive regulator of zntA
VKESRSYRIGEVAKATGVTPEALRYYEQQGLLPPLFRSAAGARRYTEDAVSRVRFIKQAQAGGLTLKDIQVLVASRAGTSRSACRKIRTVLAARIGDLDQRMSELRAFRSVLADHLRSCDQALDAPSETACPTIDAIARGNSAGKEVRT